MYYVPHTEQDRQKMLKTLGCDHIDQLFSDVNDSLLNPEIDMDEGSDMITVQAHMQELAARNTAHNMNSFLGAGAYDHFIPPILNALVGRGEFLTSYTPYQPEISQGLLQAIFEYQTMICELTGADVSNASLYDGSTAIWEAILMAARINRRRHVVIADPLNPLYREVIETHMRGADFTFERSSFVESVQQNITAVIVQYPNFLGTVEDLTALAEMCQQAGALLIVVTNPMALALFRTPVSMGADIVVGEGQPLGVPLSYGGPYFGFIATRQKYVRQLPGRICGESVDVEGRKAYVLTLQAREQHIRREKATSNICTNQALLALRGAMYMAYMGFDGMKQVAEASHKRLIYLRKALQDIEGVKIWDLGTSYCEIVVELPGLVRDYCAMARKENLILGYDLALYRSDWDHCLLIAVTEKKTENQLKALVQFLQTQTLAAVREVF